MTTKSVLLARGATKSIPLSALTPDQWGDLFGRPDVGTPAAYYRVLPPLYAGVNHVSNAVGSLPLRWLKANGEATDAPADWAQSLGDLLNAMAGDLMLYGAAYVFLGRSARGRVTTLRRMLPTTIKPVIDAQAGLTGFTRTANGRQVTLAVGDLVYVWLPNRTGEIGPGTSPAQAALAAAGALTAIDEATAFLFQNGAIRPTLVTFEGMVQDAERQRVQGWLEQKVAGIRNAFRPLAVGTTITTQTLGDKPGELAMPELTDSKWRDIASALGVPESILRANAANFATSHQDALNFYDLTVIPLVKRILSALNDQVLAEYGLTVETAESELELYQQANGEQVTALAQLFDRRVITINELRQRVGFTPLDDPQLDTPDSAPAQQETVAALPEPQDNPADNQRAELRAWERFVVKRLKDGKQPARPFKAEHLPAVTVAAIEGQIDGVADAAAVKAVFDDAARWVGYP
jgi:HK97 family phage portal protein